MDRPRVAAFYRGKGYLVHESIVVTGQSGNQQRIPLLCEGPLGNLAVFFGDAAGIDGPEIGAAKRVAKDLGATAVVAAGAFTGEQRRTAAELGVVLLDADAMEAPAPTPVASAWPGQTPGRSLERDLDAHPWPASGRPDGVDGPARSVAYDVDELLGRFERAKAATGAAAGASATAPSIQAPAAPATATAGGEGGLWKKPRASPAPPPAVSPLTSPPAAVGRPAKPGSFAWLALPKAPEPVAETEYSGTVAARATPAPASPPTPEELAAQRQERLLREATLRVWVRRGAWTLGAVVFLWLFLLWWL
jgi:hypothetical protein